MTLQALKQEMEAALTLNREAAGWEERGYWIAREYWEKLKNMLSPGFLSDPLTAIPFFRNTKPAFTSQLQYYAMVTEGSLFIPSGENEQLYWQEESRRQEWFFDKHRAFARYYYSGETHMDEQFFTLVPPNFTPSEPRIFYDNDPAFCSPKDHLVRGLLAHEMYKAFVMEKLSLRELNR